MFRQMLVAVLSVSLLLPSYAMGGPSRGGTHIPPEAAGDGERVSYKGGHPLIEGKGSGKLSFTSEVIHFEGSDSSKSFDIPVDKVTVLAGGEYAKRRVASAVVWSLLVTPLFLFMLIGKKRQHTLVIEWTEGDIDPDIPLEDHKSYGVVMFQYKKKNGRAQRIERFVESVTNMDIRYDEQIKGQ